MPEDPYSSIADLYDLAYGDFLDDVAFYENLARAVEGPVLELGVGSGRVAIPLAQAGLEVVGIDVSPSMLHPAPPPPRGPGRPGETPPRPPPRRGAHAPPAALRLCPRRPRR